MSRNLKTLLGWLLVVAGILLVLDWQDAAEQLRQESETSTRLRQRLEQQTRAVDWRVMARTAQDAQDAWLDRLVEVETTGVFRAVAMERMADLCKGLDVVCQVGAVGEKVFNESVGKTAAGQPDITRAPELPGLVSATVNVTLPLTSPGLHPLLTEIEKGHVLRSIDRLTVRSARVDLVVQNYGMFMPQLKRLRQAADPASGGQP